MTNKHIFTDYHLTVRYVPLRHVERQIKGMLYPFRCISRYQVAQLLLRYAFQSTRRACLIIYTTQQTSLHLTI